MQPQNVSVLIVDDSKFMREIIEKALRKGGFSTFFSVGSGNKALDIIKNENIDIVLLDINMVDGDGLETLEYINKNYYKKGIYTPKCIVVSAVDQLSIAEDISKLGAFGYIQKPFTEDSLITDVKKAMSGDVK
ncbi:MAG: response regulator [Nanobdellota archaeon]